MPAIWHKNIAMLPAGPDYRVRIRPGPDYHMGLLGLGPGTLDKILWISDRTSNKMKSFLYKNGKNCRKKCFPQDIKNSHMIHYLQTLISMFT